MAARVTPQQGGTFRRRFHRNGPDTTLSLNSLLGVLQIVVVIGG